MSYDGPRQEGETEFSDFKILPYVVSVLTEHSQGLKMSGKVNERTNE